MSLGFSLIVVILIVIGVLDVIKDYGDNRCQMTFMFERPEYLVCMLTYLIYHHQKMHTAVVSLNYPKKHGV